MPAAEVDPRALEILKRRNGKTPAATPTDPLAAAIAAGEPPGIIARLKQQQARASKLDSLPTVTLTPEEPAGPGDEPEPGPEPESAAAAESPARPCPDCGQELHRNGRCYHCRPGGPSGKTSPRQARPKPAPGAGPDPEVAAIAAVLAALDPLDDAARRRVVGYTVKRFALTGELL